MNAKKFLPLVLVSLLAGSGCATYAPTWSEVSGDRYTRSIMNRYPALIINVDGTSYSRALYPIKVDPGPRDIRMQGVLPGWPSTFPDQTLALTLEPCKRYYLNSQFENPVQPRWTPVIDYVETIPGCKAASS